MSQHVGYRGEYTLYGEGGIGTPMMRTRLGSLTFSSYEAAQLYARQPNNIHDRNKVKTAYVIAATLSIERPIVNTPNDPFVEFGLLAQKVGEDKTIALAQRFAPWIEQTSHWQEAYASTFPSAIEAINANKNIIHDLYSQAYPIFDDPACVTLFTSCGFDGAIHAGNRDFSKDPEFRIFHPSQARTLSVNLVDMHEHADQRRKSPRISI